MEFNQLCQSKINELILEISVILRQLWKISPGVLSQNHLHSLFHYSLICSFIHLLVALLLNHMCLCCVMNMCKPQTLCCVCVCVCIPSQIKYLCVLFFQNSRHMVKFPKHASHLASSSFYVHHP